MERSWGIPWKGDRKKMHGGLEKPSLFSFSRTYRHSSFIWFQGVVVLPYKPCWLAYRSSNYFFFGYFINMLSCRYNLMVSCVTYIIWIVLSPSLFEALYLFLRKRELKTKEKSFRLWRANASVLIGRVTSLSVLFKKFCVCHFWFLRGFYVYFKFGISLIILPCVFV